MKKMNKEKKLYVGGSLLDIVDQQDQMVLFLSKKSNG
jgi:hypothetical protein